MNRLSTPTTTRPPCRLPALLLSLLALSSAPAARAQREVIRIERVELTKSPRREELGVTIEATISGLTAEALGRCLAQSDQPLKQEQPPAATFRSIRWTGDELEGLHACSSERCVYEFPRALADQLARRRSLEQKKEAYYQLVYQLSFVDKKSKEHRIVPYQIQEPCAQHDAFHWLLNGEIKPHDALVWRKFGPSKRMQPTLMTLQHASWRAADRLCLGKTLLFADHYYDDHLELYQLRPAGDVLQLRYHTRSRLDFFDSWWGNRFRKTISRGLRDYQRSQLIRSVTRCAERALPSSS